MTLRSETKELAHRYRRAAARLDADWLRTADPRAVQGDDVCEDARNMRALADQLDTIADEAVWLEV